MLTVITEFLSALKLLNFGGLVGLWLLADLGIGFFYWQLRQQRKEPVNEKNEQESSQISTFLKVLLASLILIVIAVGVVAIVAPPNNWDSMNYHLARVMHWIQNRSVEAYPAHYLPQIYIMPWSAYAIAHFQILSNGDRFANLVQWLTMIGSIIGVSLIAQELGANIRGQI